jgi:hypothetical protein
VAKVGLATRRWLSETCRSATMVLGNQPISARRVGISTYFIEFFAAYFIILDETLYPTTPRTLSSCRDHVIID